LQSSIGKFITTSRLDDLLTEQRSLNFASSNETSRRNIFYSHEMIKEALILQFTLPTTMLDWMLFSLLL
jgi:hypothetical protein